MGGAALGARLLSSCREPLLDSATNNNNNSLLHGNAPEGGRRRRLLSAEGPRLKPFPSEASKRKPYLRRQNEVAQCPLRCEVRLQKTVCCAEAAALYRTRRLQASSVTGEPAAQRAQHSAAPNLPSEA